MEDKRTVFEWMNKLNVRPAIHNEELYKGNKEYTLEEFNKLVPYETQVTLYAETETKEMDLTLAVQKLELGTLTTNAIAVRDKVKDLLNNFKVENYNEDNIDKAKEDKALLNTTSKKLNDERIRLEKEFMKPFSDFKDVVSETTAMIKDASAKIDEIVKEVENKAKELKKSEIQKVYEKAVSKEAISSLINLEMIFDERYLNKTYEIDKVGKDLEDKIYKIARDLEAIKNLKSEHELALTNQYLKTFNLGEVIIENNRLNELKQNTAKVEIKQEEIVKEKIDEIITTKVISEDEEDTRTYELSISGTLDQHRKLKEFLQLNSMHTVNIKTNKVIVE